MIFLCRPIAICLFLLIFFVPRTQAQSIKQEWTAIPSAEFYEYEVSQEEGFQAKHLIKTGSTPSPRFELSLDPGVYFYRVRALNKAAEPGPWSAPARIGVAGPKMQIRTPLENEIIEVPEKNSDVIFEWNTVVGAQYYVLRIDHKRETKSHKVFLPRVRVALGNQGKHHFKIEAYNGVHPISQSESIPFTLQFSKTPPPRILEPRDTHVLPAYEPFPLRWIQLSPSRWTEVSVIRLDTNKEVVSSERINDSEKHEIQALNPGHYQIAVRNYLDDGGQKYTESAVTIKVELNPNSLTRPLLGFELRLVGGANFGFNGYKSHLAPDGWLASQPGSASTSLHLRAKFPVHEKWGAELGIHQANATLRAPPEQVSTDGNDTDFSDTSYYLGTTYKWSKLGPTKPVLLKGLLFFEGKTPLALVSSGSFGGGELFQKFNEQFWGLGVAAELRWFGWHPRWDIITEHRLDFYLISAGSVFGQARPNFFLPSLRSEVFARRKLSSDLRLLIGGQLYLQDLSMTKANFESTRAVTTLGIRLGLEFAL
jgi:hypothetical protein